VEQAAGVERIANGKVHEAPLAIGARTRVHLRGGARQHHRLLL
jgi:hypothetical protein